MQIIYAWEVNLIKIHLQFNLRSAGRDHSHQLTATLTLTHWAGSTDL